MLLLFFILVNSFVTSTNVHISPPDEPSYSMPIECDNDIINKYINDFKTNELKFDNITNKCKTLDEFYKVIELDDCSPIDSHVGFVWKEILDEPIIIGITRGVKSDHEPHYHLQPECYYVTEGETVTLANNSFMTFKRDQYLYIPSNTIHNTPIMNETFGVLYWFPNDKHFENVEYHFASQATCEDIEQFNKVNEIRQEFNICQSFNNIKS